MKKNLSILLLSICIGLCFLSCSCANVKTVKLSFVTDNGQYILPIHMVLGEEIALPDKLIKTGYIFQGWFTDSERTIPFDFKAVTKDMTLYAKWQRKAINITFYYYDGNTLSKIAEYGDAVDFPTDTEIEGYTFLGWYTDESLKIDFDKSTLITDDLELYGKWVEKIYHNVTILDWDKTVVFENDIEEGCPLGKTELFMETIEEFGGFHVNGRRINAGTYTVFTATVINIVYDYPISDVELFTFSPCEGGYYIGAAAEIHGDIFLPPTYNGKPVIGINSANAESDKSVESAEVAEFSESGAFYGSKINYIYIPSTYSLIGAYSFYKCESLANVEFKSGVPLIIEKYAFYQTSLDSVSFTDGIIGIEEGAFENCGSLKNIYFPKTLAWIGNAVFKYCISLEEITVDSENSTFVSKDGNLLSYDQKYFYCYAYGNVSKSFNFYSSVETIAPYAFARAYYLETINFPADSKLEVVGEYAFEYCSRLQGIEFPDSVLTIETYAFSNCFALETAVLSQTSRLTAMYDYAFAYCKKLQNFYIPKDTVILDTKGEAGAAKAFTECEELFSLTVSSQNPYYSSVDGVLYNKNKTILYCYPVAKNGAVFEMEKSVTVIHAYAFYFNKYLSEIILPQNLTDIGIYAFSFSAIEKIKFPASLKSIDTGAFWNCKKLEIVEFETDAKIEFIGEFSFYHCDSLSEFIITAGLPPVGIARTVNFLSYGATTRIYVPFDALETYKQKWADYKDNIFPIESFSSI